jgi:hypothetical protein
MRSPRPRSTLRLTMVALLIVGFGLAVLRMGWDEWQAREWIRGRVARRQNLINRIGKGNNAVGWGRSGETASGAIILEEEKRRAEAELRMAEEAIAREKPQPGGPQ